MWLTIRSGPDAGKTLEMTGERFVIGREEGCDLVLADDKASRRHAALEPLPGGRAVLRDLGSTNGTHLAGERVAAPVVLSGGEEFQIGDTVISVAAQEPAAAPEAGAPASLETAAAPVQAPAAAPPSAQPPATPPPPPVAAPPPPPAAALAPLAAVPPPTASRIERIMLRREVRRAQRIAAVAGIGVVVTVVVVVLFVSGVVGGEEKAPTVPEIIAAVKTSTVQIRVVQNGSSQGMGSGWVLDAANGFIVTNAHVANEGVDFSIRLGDEERERPARLLGVAPCEDLAVLQTDDREGLVTLSLGSQTDLRQGDEVIALGYPISLSESDELIATDGVVSVVQTKASLGDGSEYTNAIQTDAVINPGNSGGPLVNADKELVGVNTFKTAIQGVEGQFYAIGVDHVKEVAPKLAQGHSLAWVGMGFSYPQSADELTQVGLPGTPGLVVARAVPGTAAANAGLGQAPALLVGINGQPIDTTLGSYCKAVGTLEEGATATFSVIVAGSTQAQDVTLAFE